MGIYQKLAGATNILQLCALGKNKTHCISVSFVFSGDPHGTRTHIKGTGILHSIH